MSISTWKKEFYPEPPSENMTAEEATLHSILKWEGLTQENLEKHGLTLSHGVIYETYGSEGNTFEIDQNSCALCVAFKGADELDCSSCPLYQSSWMDCADVLSPYREFLRADDPGFVLQFLRDTLKFIREGKFKDTRVV